jgi:lysozyme family protein
VNRFEECFKLVLNIEGGYSDNPADKGGKTNYGITEYTLNAAYKAGLVKHNDITKLTVDDAKIIYRANYWDKNKCYMFPKPLDFLIFDATVNHGIEGAGELLQKSVNYILKADVLKVDGVIGPITIETANAFFGQYKSTCTFPVDDLCKTFLLERVEKYNKIIGKNSSQKAFIHGWLNRIRKNYEIIGG